MLTVTMKNGSTDFTTAVHAVIAHRTEGKTRLYVESVELLFDPHADLPPSFIEAKDAYVYVMNEQGVTIAKYRVDGPA